MKALKISILINMVLQGELGRLRAFLAFYEIFLPSAYILNQCGHRVLSQDMTPKISTIMETSIFRTTLVIQITPNSWIFP